MGYFICFLRTTILTILFFLLLSGQMAFSQSPGGVSTNLKFWVKGGVGAGTVGTNSSQWLDQSGNGLNALQPTAAAQPAIMASQINFNQALVFNGTSDYMDVASVLGLSGTTGYAVYLVLMQSGATLQTMLGTQFGSNGPASLDMQLYNTPGSPLGQDCYGFGTVMTGTTNTQVGVPYIAGYERTGTGANGATLYFNGNLDKTTTISQSLGTNSKRIGSSYTGAGNSYFTNGDIAEIIVYNAALASAANRSRIQSYLSFKYGFPPPAGSGFINSAGTAFWTYDATYFNNIFGIGRDDGSGLSQNISNSYLTGSGNGTGQSGKGNIVLSNPSALNNEDFIAVGSNSAALTETNTNLPPGEPATVLRLARQWKVNHTNAVGATVTLTFNTSGGFTTGTTAADYALLIDNDGDGNFATGVITTINAASYIGGIVTFNAVNLPNNAIFTFVTKNAVLLPLTFLNFTGRLMNANEAALFWETGDESDVSHFDIERSPDGGNFAPIGQQPFSSSHNYSYTDNKPAAGNNFYRIKSVDLDGNFLYSSVLNIAGPGNSALITKLLNSGTPQSNPVLSFSAPNPISVHINLLTSDGGLVSSSNRQLNAGGSTQTILTSGLAKGIYILDVTGKDYHKSFRFALY